MITRLRNLSRESEGQFLSLGGKLGEYQRRAEVQATVAYDAVSTMSSHGLVETIHNLESFRTRLILEVRNIHDCMDKALEALSAMRLSVDALAMPLDGFRRVTKNLGSLSVSSRIETARLVNGNEGFTILAENVDKLSTLINAKLRLIREKADLLGLSLGETQVIVSGFSLQEDISGKNVLIHVTRALDSLKTRVEQCLESGRIISSGSKEISEDLGNIVVNLQFHDIVRQKLEHVCSALTDVAGPKENVEGDEKFGPSSENGSEGPPPPDACAICGLQAHQLVYAVEEFSLATGDIRASLNRCAGRVREIAEEFGRAVRGEIREGETSRRAEVETILLDLFSSLEKDAAKIFQVSGAMKTIVATVDDILPYLSDIEEIGSEIELIALNARVKSVSLGEGGAPLAIVSNAIQGLSSDAYANASALMTQLANLKNAADLLIGVADMASQVKEDTYRGDDLKSLLASIRSFKETAMPLLADIEKRGQDLSSDLEDTIGAFDGGVRFAAEIEEDIAGLRSLSGNHDNQVNEKGWKDEAILKLQGLYSMNSERKVHESYGGQERDPEQDVSGRGVKTKINQGLGDNVELF